MHDGDSASPNRAVRDIFNSTFRDQLVGTAGPTAWPSRFTSDMNPLNVYPWGQLKLFTITLRISVSLSAITSASLNRCGSP
jgi:hypothetical protein